MHDMAVEALREVALDGSLGVEHHETIWIVYRTRGPITTGMIVSPHGERISRTIAGDSRAEVRDRLLTPRSRDALRRRFPRGTIVSVEPDEDIPEPLRRAFRSVWGPYYGG